MKKPGFYICIYIYITFKLCCILFVNLYLYDYIIYRMEIQKSLHLQRMMKMEELQGKLAEIEQQRLKVSYYIFIT